MSTTRFSRLGSFCTQYGPGRLPGASRHALGAGYAFASAALATTAVFVLPSLLAASLGSDGLATTFLLFAPAALPFVLVSSFLSGLFVWRYGPVSTPRDGAFAGIVVTALTYVLSVALLLPVMLVGASGDWYFSVPGAVGTAVLVGVFATLLTAPVALPAGATSGYLYERVRAAKQRQ